MKVSMQAYYLVICSHIIQKFRILGKQMHQGSVPTPLIDLDMVRTWADEQTSLLKTTLMYI